MDGSLASRRARVWSGLVKPDPPENYATSSGSRLGLAILSSESGAFRWRFRDMRNSLDSAEKSVLGSIVQLHSYYYYYYYYV